jgi:hypothetical protein
VIELLLFVMGLYLGMIAAYALAADAWRQGWFGSPTTLLGWALVPYYLVRQLVAIRFGV